MAGLQSTVEQLKELLHRAREDWIAEDREEWLAASRFYNEVLHRTCSGAHLLGTAMISSRTRQHQPLAPWNFCKHADIHRLVDRGVQVYVITTKDRLFTLELLNAVGLPIDADRVFGLGSGPKETVLADILAKAGDVSR